MGQRVVQEAVTVLKNVSWGIAGRDRFKLEEVLLDVSQRLDVDLCDRPIYIANALDGESLYYMVDRCRVLVNCCAPYEIYGEAIVAACVQAGTHYVDLSIGAYFPELMQMQFNCNAKRREVYIIPGCGFHSLPYDLAVGHLQRHFGGVINSVEAYTDYWFENDNFSLPFAHGGLWTGIVMACANVSNVKGIRNRLQRRELPNPVPKVEYKPPHECAEMTRGVFLPMPIHETVDRTQYYYFERERRRPIQFFSYVAVPTLIMAFVFMIWSFVLCMLAQIKAARVLLIQLPRLFTFGCFSSDGPDICQTQRLNFCITMKATGWSARRQCDQDYEPNKTLILTMSGRDPLYGVSCLCLLFSALTLIQDPMNLPECGGVYTPAVIFEHTHFLTELQTYEHGFMTELYPQ